MSLTSPGRRPSPWVAAVAVGVLVLTGTTVANAATRVTVTNPGGLTAVGPSSSDHGFPAWYEDSTGTRIEPCLDIDNPMCGFLPGDVPDDTIPISFPDNFPGEFFYQLVASELDLPGGGRAVLTLGLEAAFTTEEATPGNQVVFARTRVVVRDAPANATLTFRHPFGELTIDTDETGAGRLVEDIAPSVGNFTLALTGNFGPFLKWDPATAPAAPAGFVGDPGIAHTVIGGKDGYNRFSVTGPGLSLDTDQFTISGKIATNTGLAGTRASITDGFLDVFATSKSIQLQVDGVEGQYATTPMTNDDGSEYHYARIALEPGAAPTQVTVRNLSDDPVSTATIDLEDIVIDRAEYNGTVLTIQATATTYPVTIDGIGQLTDTTPTEFTLTAPPAHITAHTTTGPTTTHRVTITGGTATPSTVPPGGDGEDPGDNDGGTNPDLPPGPPEIVIAPLSPATPGSTVTIDASATKGATEFTWTQTGGPAVQLADASTATPRLSIPPFVTASTTVPAAPWAPITLHVVARNATTELVTTADVTVPVLESDLAVTVARHKVGQELRIGGTSLIGGVAGPLSPPTQVLIWNNTNPAAPVLLGRVPVDTVGGWELRQKPGPAVRITAVLVQTSRGGTLIASVAAG
ncbi:hypothetical protein [Microbacterium hominis]|uniref:Uncharacterized protein n=1 Tax=Microbacterium hominis TaxID=162426 RepID=A0A7D4TLJ2_9MICO|nr:hypothetical protein [Microbacterium hominis]QKJ18302.1 hypothetical protein HQM25_02055 [Microbacterium hominis]